MLQQCQRGLNLRSACTWVIGIRHLTVKLGLEVCSFDIASHECFFYFDLVVRFSVWCLKRALMIVWNILAKETHVIVAFES